MNPDAKECFDTAASLLQQVTKCQPSVAAMIVQQIALGAIRWDPEQPGAMRQRNADLFAAWQAGYDEALKNSGSEEDKK